MATETIIHSTKITSGPRDSSPQQLWWNVEKRRVGVLTKGGATHEFA